VPIAIIFAPSSIDGAPKIVAMLIPDETTRRAETITTIKPIINREITFVFLFDHFRVAVNFYCRRSLFCHKIGVRHKSSQKKNSDYGTGYIEYYKKQRNQRGEKQNVCQVQQHVGAAGFEVTKHC
jgi:ABC-type Fe3+/spermidine/putrescine transport system ATPase subunit